MKKLYKFENMVKKYRLNKLKNYYGKLISGIISCNLAALVDACSTLAILDTVDV
jgi:hypothetical protein